MTTKDAKRDEIKERIAAAQARNAERNEPSLADTVSEKAMAAKDGFVDFAKKHPAATVAGGVVLGLLVASMFSGPRRVAGKAAVAAGSKAAGLAAIGSEMAVAFAKEAMDTAQDAKRAGGEKLEDLADSVGDSARSLKREASYRADNASDTARIVARDVGKTIARSFRKH